MDFFLVKGKNFKEHFDFRNEQGKLIAMPAGNYRIVLERGDFAREYTINNGLVKTRNIIYWNISGSESADFDFTTMYYTLYVDDNELARGVLKIQ